MHGIRGGDGGHGVQLRPAGGNELLEVVAGLRHRASITALADTDGPVMKFRKWASQFYADPVDTGAEAYPPQGVYPAPERELTASKKFGNPDSAFAIDKD